MEVKLINDPTTPKGAIQVKFSFREYFNLMKKIGEAAPTCDHASDPDPDPDFISKVNKFKEWGRVHDVAYPKLAYPAFFVERPGIVCCGMRAMADIGPKEVREQLDIMVGDAESAGVFDDYTAEGLL
jgi:hypothetical protein